MKHMMNVNGGLRLAALAVWTCLVGTVAAVDATWIGGASGNWCDAKNWRGGVVPNGADAVARIESTSDVAISVGSGTYTVGAIHAAGGNHAITGTGSINLNASSGTGVVDVAESAALTVGCRLDAAAPHGTALAKTGRGTFEVTNLVGRARPLNGIDVRQGTFNFNEKRGGDHINPGGRVTVRAGATANLMTANLLVNDTVIDVKAGGTFDAHDKSDLIAAIVGEGLVTNSVNFRLTLKGGPHVFSGRFSGRVTLERWKGHSGSLTDVGYEPDNVKRRWVVGTRDGLADATVAFVSDPPDDRPLSFSPTAGGVFTVGAIEPLNGKPVELKDTAGNPVEVRPPPAMSEHEFYLAQLRAECARFNAAAVERALNDLARNPAYDAARHRVAVKAFAARRDWVAAHLGDADVSVRAEAAALVEGYRAAFLANPALDFDRILCVRRRMRLPKNDGTRQLGLQDINAHNHMRVQRTGFNNEIAVISNLRGRPAFTTIYKPQGTELVRDLDLDFDASRVSFTQHRGNDMWGVFEIELGPDGKAKGSGCVEVSPRDYPDVHWANGCYLPNRDQVIVLGSGVYQYLPCEDGNMPMMVLYRIDRKTGEVRQLTYEQDSDYTPSVLNDGRVVFTRWEYSDMQHYFARELMTMNPDGVGQLSLWGSGSYFPTFFYKARAIPDDPHRLVMIAGGHHGVAEKGRMLLVDPSLARAKPYRYDPPSRAWGPTLHKLRVPAQVLPASQTGLVQEFPGWGQDVEGDVCDLQVNNQFDRGKPYMSYPYPLDGKYYLATCQMEPLGRFGIYLVDVFDNMILLAEAPDGMLFEPIPLRARKRPPVIPDRSDPAKKDCTVHIADIHAGPGLAGVPRGTVKKLRLFAYHFNYHKTGGHVSVGLDRAESSWDIKRVLGTVDVEADGSCCFRMPARLPVSIQPLDAEGRAVQLMRSWVVGMPGERVSCTGCHEDNRTSVATGRKQADLKPIQEIVPMDGDGVRPFAFATEMWPLLQKRCGACHGNPATAPVRAWDQGGDGKTARLAMCSAEEGYRFVHPYVRRPGSESELPMLNPMEYHASTSPLVQMLKKGHHGVALDDAEWRVLYTWIDLNAPWRGKWNPPEPEQPMRRLALSRLFGGNRDDPEREYDRHEALVKARLNGKMVKSAASQPLNCAEHNLKPEGRLNNLKAEGRFNHLKVESGWPMSELDAFALQAGRVDQRAPVTVRTIELGAGQSMTFRRIPAGTFVMGSADGAPDETPCVVTIERPFWISETEVRNDQFRAFNPAHDSRHQDQYGFDQIVPGFVGTHRLQPAVRLTWNEAMDFCRWLSKKIGVKATLPTEAQWEWAARAGTATPFPWGGLDDDFSKHANLADRDVRFIYSSWDGPATVQRRREYKHTLNYPLHEERFVDDWFSINYVARGLPNTWGLYDMHGNAAEWTRSAYRPYPYRADDGREDESAEGPKAVRGGSFASRPRNATSSWRWGYDPWQKVYDVGFRVLIEE